MGFERAGMECVWQVENDKYCQEVLAEHWKGVKRFSDVREVGKHNLQPVDLICGGFPCFPSGTLILTDKGYVPIEDVTRGTMVFTHRGRLMPVISTMKRDNADIISLSGRGNNKIRTTKEHPFYCREYGYKYENRVKHINLTEPSWEAAENMLDKYWASPTAFTKTNIPKFEYEHINEIQPCEINENFFWFVGLWLGDGWIRRHKRYGRDTDRTNDQVYICANFGQSDYIESRLEEIGFHTTIIKDRTANKIIISNKALARWLSDNFGEGACNKSLPYWMLGIGANYRQALLDGYIYADGEKKTNKMRATTVSKKLAHSMKLLGQSLGYSVSVLGYDVAKNTTIEGRIVNQRYSYGVYLYSHHRKTHVIDNITYGKVRRVEFENKKETVYNISVESDESYVADGLIVHNCQDLSVAGKRAGFDGERSSLWFEFERIIDELRPQWVVIENVPGLLSSKKGADLEQMLASLNNLGYYIDVNILDSQNFGVPQRRRRIFLVCQKIDTILNSKTILSVTIILQCLIEILLTILVEAKGLSTIGLPNSDLQRKYSVDGLIRKMNLFGITNKEVWNGLLTHLIDMLPLFPKEQKNLELVLEELHKNECKVMDMSQSENNTIIEDMKFLNMLELWNSIWDESYATKSVSTISTALKQTTELKIYTCAKIALAISSFILLSKQLCQNFSILESFASTMKGAYTNYARQTSSQIFTEHRYVLLYGNIISQSIRMDRNESVGSLGNTSCGQVLFESEGLRGDIEEGKKEGKDIASTITRRIGGNGSGWPRWDEDKHLIAVSALQARDYKGVGNQYVQEGKVIATLRSGGCGGVPSSRGEHLVVSTLRGFGHGGQHNDTNAVMTYWDGGQVSDTLDSSMLMKGQMMPEKRRMPAVMVANWQSGGGKMDDTISPSLSAGAEHNAQFVWQMNHADEVYRDCGEIFPTLQNRMGTGGNNVPLIGVRRLTPTECERLQGFPDGWTASQSDTQRYKQMGNAVTVNVIEWIGKRIVNENL